MRFKPPPPNSTIGWRVEFRSMEVQLTDFENAAFSVFVVLLTRALLSFNLNFYLPISKVRRAGRARSSGGVLSRVILSAWCPWCAPTCSRSAWTSRLSAPWAGT